MAEQRRNSRNTKSTKVQPVNDYGRIQPQAPELEEAVLGALMIEKDAYSLVSEILRPESFYEHRHQLIYAAITDLAVNQKPVDILTVKEQLSKRGELEEVGGPFYITQLSSKVASSAHIEYHARIIAQKSLARELITFTSNIQSKAFDETLDVDDLMQEAEGKLFEISQQNMKKDYTQINPVIDEAYKLIQKAAARTDGLSGLESGFTKLDKMTSGWQNSDLIIIAARPAMGKTAFVLNIAQKAAVRDHVPTAIFSLEMSKEQLVTRMMAMEAMVDSQSIRTGDLQETDWEKIMESAGTIGRSPLIIDDTPEAVVLSGFDPVRREVARIALERLIVDGRIHPARIEEMVEKAQKEVENMMREEGEAAILEVGIHNIHPELVKLLGKMKFRTSYGQNALKHSIEVAQLSGLLAAEIGVDVRMAKRAGLLHDIGKSVDHEMEGSHVQLGSELCKKYKESPIVINAVESHHGDVEPTNLISCIVQAADTISAARPGARRETLETYTNRLKQLEDITNSFKGVDKTFAIQAGREIRIMVVPEQVSDSDMILLARDISKQIESELSYPGQIKVNVIRESRVTEYAK